MDLNFTIISGTNRPGNKTQRVAKYLFDLSNNYEGVKARIIKPSDFNLSVDGNDEENKDPDYTKIVSETDAFIIVSPEYNHSFPGSLKSLLDKELRAYNHRAVGVVGVSSGGFGGARVVEALAPVVRELGLTLSHTALHIMRVSDTVDEDGKTDDKMLIENADRFYKELIWVASALKTAREKE